MNTLQGIDLTKLFNNESSYGKRFRFPAPTEAQIRRAEEKLGYKLSPSYRELLSIQNGGIISDELSESWLTTIYGIAPEQDAENGLEEMFDNWRDEWEYPDIGIPFGETQSAGHDMYYMDYRVLNANGEPRIVRVDVEDMDDPKFYLVAPDLPAFLRLILADEELRETPL
ncbi:MAG: SMI1/KNR4 family protein [Oscillospiraceae bacterium]|nr:SMI1/KNR4 family protein [Oscillospiraceae bacterium]